MNKQSIIIFFSILSLLFLAIRTAEAASMDREEIIKEYEEADMNKDGYVDEEEYRAYIKKRYASMETNGEEKFQEKGLKKEEFVREKEKERMTFEEFFNGRLRFFREADVNKDALLSLEEYIRMRLIDPVK